MKKFRVWNADADPVNIEGVSFEIVTTAYGKTLKIKPTSGKMRIFKPDQWVGFTEVVPEIVPKPPQN